MRESRRSSTSPPPRRLDAAARAPRRSFATLPLGYRRRRSSGRSGFWPARNTTITPVAWRSRRIARAKRSTSPPSPACAPVRSLYSGPWPATRRASRPRPTSTAAPCASPPHLVSYGRICTRSWLGCDSWERTPGAPSATPAPCCGSPTESIRQPRRRPARPCRSCSPLARNRSSPGSRVRCEAAPERANGRGRGPRSARRRSKVWCCCGRASRSTRASRLKRCSVTRSSLGTRGARFTRWRT